MKQTKKTAHTVPGIRLIRLQTTGLISGNVYYDRYMEEMVFVLSTDHKPEGWNPQTTFLRPDGTVVRLRAADFVIANRFMNVLYTEETTPCRRK